RARLHHLRRDGRGRRRAARRDDAIHRARSPRLRPLHHGSDRAGDGRHGQSDRRHDRRYRLYRAARSAIALESGLLGFLRRADPVRHRHDRHRRHYRHPAPHRRSVVGPDQPMTAETVLETERLNRSFGALRVTQDVSFKLPRGARYALIGPNGAGKSTFINLLTGVLKPSGGRIKLHGEDITRAPAQDRVRRGLVRTFQINTLFPHLTPLEATVLAIAQRHGLCVNPFKRLSGCHAEIDEAHELLDRFQFGADGERPTHELAYGRQRLLEIVLALAARPKVLLLDEPAAGVPQKESAEIFEALAAL